MVLRRFAAPILAHGQRYLEDVLETMGDYVDTLKFAGGSFTLMPRVELMKCWSFAISIT